MKYDSMSNSDFFEMTQNKKILASESKIKWEFIKYYTILSLIFLWFYRIVVYIIQNKYERLFNNFQFTISDAEGRLSCILHQKARYHP